MRFHVMAYELSSLFVFSILVLRIGEYVFYVHICLVSRFLTQDWSLMNVFTNFHLTLHRVIVNLGAF